MINNNIKFDAATYATTQGLDSVSMESYNSFALQYSATVTTADAQNFKPGVAEVTDIVCSADAGVKEIQTITLPAKASATDGDYVVFYDTLGKKYAVALDKAGTGIEPTGTIWSGIIGSRKKVCDISGQTTAAQVAAKVLLSIKQIEEYSTSIFTWVDSGSGVLTGTQAKVGAVTNPVPKSIDDAGAGSILGAQSTGGVASSLQNKYFSLYAGGSNAQHCFWFNVNSEGSIPTVENSPTMHEVAIDASASDTDVATALNAVIDALDSTFSSSVSTATVTATNDVKGSVTDASDSGTTGFTISATTQGVDDAFANGFTNDQIIIASHGFYTGLKAALTTSDADAPAGTSATDYWIRRIDANTISLHTSAAHALAGTGRVDITDAGSGTHTLTPAALTGGNIKLQESIDGTNWSDISGATANITATGTGLIQGTSKCSMLRPYLTVTTGQIGLSQNWFTKQ